jgi:uncharacterized protein (TIGR02996 family)
MSFPDPAARLPGEADLLAHVLADLRDDARRLVYADWLEEHADPRGEYLRRCVAAHRAGGPLPDGSAFPKPWRDLCGLTLIADAHELGLANRLDVLLRLARPAVTITTARVAERELPVGASKCGGRPDLPADGEWPTGERTRLAFLGQLNFAELAGSVVARELPPAGLLSIFYDAEECHPEDWRIVHMLDSVGLTRIEEPDDLTDGNRFHPCRLSFAETLTLPGWDSTHLDASRIGEQDEAYFALLGHEPGHRLLGHPLPIQGDVLDNDPNRCHLLTIDTDTTGPDWMWGDVGALYFTISAADLQDGRFGQVRVEMQCG